MILKPPPLLCRAGSPPAKQGVLNKDLNSLIKNLISNDFQSTEAILIEEQIVLIKPNINLLRFRSKEWNHSIIPTMITANVK
jgi:hypothetical protein